ncbi:type II secretion system protein [Candidatus Saccharibacteria bacterium]|nr:type II secretion system protein [Candidatus Saccharibacteria bacterium]
MLYRVHKKLGFTIVELIVVIAMIGILAAIGIVMFNGVQDRAYNLERLNEMKGWENIFTIYAAQEKKYPSVPALGGYCLGSGFPTKTQIDDEFSSWGSPPAASARWSPAETANPAEGYCRNIMSYGSGNWQARHAVNTSLNTQLSSVGKLPSNQQFGGDYDWMVTPYVTYQGTNSVIISQAFIGTTCPKTTTPVGPAGTNLMLCQITLSPRYSFDITP